MHQLDFSNLLNSRWAVAPKGQLLKWIGSKYRFAEEIGSYFPENYGRYFEPFLGSGAVLATLAPKNAVGSDTFSPLVEIWQTLRNRPEELKLWYAGRYRFFKSGDKKQRYEQIKTAYNNSKLAADLLFLCRACYGGVVRFRKADGFMSTPCGIHDPISPESFARRVDEWHMRVSGAEFVLMDYKNAMRLARAGDLIYCDPPYSFTQAILYGAQSFSLSELIAQIKECKDRGVFVALSIDGTKKSGKHQLEIPSPNGLFETEIFIDCGRSMLKRFQMEGRSLEKEKVTDRLLLTYSL